MEAFNWTAEVEEDAKDEEAVLSRTESCCSSVHVLVSAVWKCCCRALRLESSGRVWQCRDDVSVWVKQVCGFHLWTLSVGTKVSPPEEEFLTLSVRGPSTLQVRNGNEPQDT